MTDSTYITPMHSGLPDPVLDRQFYTRVTSKRLVAWAIDAVVIGLLSLLFSLIVAIFTLGLGFLILPPIIVTTSFLYRSFSIGNRSATWGMRMMGIELRDRNGDRFDLTNAAIHTLLYFLSVATVIGWLISVILMLASPRGQGLPDMLLGSAAINRPLTG